LSYTYDDQQNITSKIDGTNTAYSLGNLTYDGLDRLTSVSGNSGIGSSTISYDGLGNITRYTSKGRDLGYTYNTSLNRLTAVADPVGGKNFNYTNGYDDRGNVPTTALEILSSTVLISSPTQAVIIMFTTVTTAG
jgi:YD repeat-containing protein